MATRDCTYFVTLITLALVLMWWSLNLTAEGGEYYEEEDFDDADDAMLRRMVRRMWAPVHATRRPALRATLLLTPPARTPLLSRA